MTWRSALPALVVLALIVLFYRGLQLGDPGRLASPFIGKPAPRFDMPSLFDATERVVIDRFAGQPFVLNVWGTWCPECYREHETLLRIAEQGTVPLVGLNWRDERGKAVAYLQQAGNPFTMVGSDPDGRNAIDWGVYGAPETFLIDASGTVIHKHIGALDWATWEEDFLGRLPAATGAQLLDLSP